MMNFPDKLDFLEAFGLDPIDEATEMGYLRYLKVSECGNLDLELSLSELQGSFEVNFRVRHNLVVNITSEYVHDVSIFRDGINAGVVVKFQIESASAQAIVNFEPDLGCKWVLLRS